MKVLGTFPVPEGREALNKSMLIKETTNTDANNSIVFCIPTIPISLSNRKGAKTVKNVPKPSIIAISPLRIPGVTHSRSIKSVLDTVDQLI